jgi:hypothetical protein
MHLYSDEQVWEVKPVAVMREIIVRQTNPQLDNKAVVDTTAGLLKSEIANLFRTYREGTDFPEIGAYDRCRKPRNRGVCRTTIGSLRACRYAPLTSRTE